MTDNLLRFFYTYVYSNKSALQMLGAEAFFEEYIEPSLVTPMTQKQMKEEVRQIARIKGIKVGEIGFISISGFEEKSKDYICLDGASLYQ